MVVRKANPSQTKGTRPFLRCQGRILLSMLNARRIANLPLSSFPETAPG